MDDEWFGIDCFAFWALCRTIAAPDEFSWLAKQSPLVGDSLTDYRILQKVRESFSFLETNQRSKKTLSLFRAGQSETPVNTPYPRTPAKGTQDLGSQGCLNRGREIFGSGRKRWTARWTGKRLQRFSPVKPGPASTEGLVSATRVGSCLFWQLADGVMSMNEWQASIVFFLLYNSLTIVRR